MEKEKKKSSWKFYATLIIGSALVVGGGYYFSQMYNVISNNESGNDQWNNIEGGSFEELPVGYSIDVPDKVNENLERKEDYIYRGQIKAKYDSDYTFNDLFYGNLRPKDYDVLTNKVWIINDDISLPEDNYYYNMFVDLYLNYANIVSKNSNLGNKEYVKEIIKTEIRSFDMYYKIEMNEETYIDYVREIEKYNLEEPNDFYRMVANNYQNMFTNYVYGIVQREGYYTGESDVAKMFPEIFNGSTDLEENYSLVPNISKITKTNENEITIQMTADKPCYRGDFGFIIDINEYFKLNSTIDNSKIIYLMIKDKNIPEGNIVTLRLGGYPTNQIYNSIYLSRWYPNKDGIKVINRYFEIMNNSLTSNEQFDPKSAIKMISDETKFMYDDVLNCVMSYIYINVML